MNLRWILDPAAGNRARVLILFVTGIITIAAQVLDDIEAAGWAITLPVVLSALANFTKLGNAPAAAEPEPALRREARAIHERTVREWPES